MSPAYYAIRRDDYVEIRRSRKPPKVVINVLSKNVPIEIDHEWEICTQQDEGAIEYDSWWHPGYLRDAQGHPPRWIREKKVFEDKIEKIRIVTIKGGRRIGVPIKARLFARWTGHSLSEGVVWPLPEKMGDAVVRRYKDWLKRNE